MMQITSSLTANLFISIENNIDKVGGGPVMVEVDIVCKNSEAGYFTLGARLAIAKLNQAFSTTPILHNFDSKYHICIKTDVSGYDIGKTFCPQNSDGLGQ